MSQEERILRLENAMSTLAEGSADYHRRASRLEESFVMLVEMVRRHGERLDESRVSQDELRAAQAELTEAQANSEVKIAALADAQIRTEDALRELKEIQAEVARELKEAQANSDAKFATLADAQTRTEAIMEQLGKNVNSLTEAQTHTEQKLDALIDIVRDERDGRPPASE